MEEFRSGATRVLIATDVWGRGLDVQQVGGGAGLMAWSGTGACRLPRAWSVVGSHIEWMQASSLPVAGMRPSAWTTCLEGVSALIGVWCGSDRGGEKVSRPGCWDFYSHSFNSRTSQAVAATSAHVLYLTVTRRAHRLGNTSFCLILFCALAPLLGPCHTVALTGLARHQLRPAQQPGALHPSDRPVWALWAEGRGDQLRQERRHLHPARHRTVLLDSDR